MRTETNALPILYQSYEFPLRPLPPWMELLYKAWVYSSWPTYSSTRYIKRVCGAQILDKFDDFPLYFDMRCNLYRIIFLIVNLT